MAYKNANPLEDSVGDDSHQCSDYWWLIGKPLHPRVRSAPHFRALQVEHAPRHDSKQSMNYPPTTSTSSFGPLPTLSSVSDTPTTLFPPSVSYILSPDQLSSTSSSTVFLPSQSDPSPSSPVEYPTSADSSLVFSSTSASLIITSSNAAFASGSSQPSMPIVTSTGKNTHVGIIVGGVLGGIAAVFLVVTACCLFRKTKKGRKRGIGYDNLPSEDERPYLRGLEGDDHWGQYPSIDGLHAYEGQEPQGIDEHGHYLSLLQHGGQYAHHSYPLSTLAQKRQEPSVTFAPAREESQSVRMQDSSDSDVRRSDVESDSLANDFAGIRGKITSSLGARSSSSDSILSRARAAFDFTPPRVSIGSLSSSSRTTVDINQISWPRQLQKSQRPAQPKRDTG